VSDDRLEQLWADFLSGRPLSPQEQKELIDALQADERRREDWLAEFEIHRFLHGSARSGRDSEMFERAFKRGVEAQKDATRFIKKIESQIEDARSPVPPTPSLPGEHSTPRAGTPRPRTRRGLRTGGRAPSDIALKVGLAAAGAFAAVILLLTVSSPGPVSSGGPKTGRELAQREERLLKEFAARQEEATQARAERERLERELVQAQKEHGRVSEEKTRAQDEKTQEELKAREAELAKTAEEFREKLRRAQEKERQAAERVARTEPALPSPEVTHERSGTRAAIAKVERVEGQVTRVTPEGASALKSGEDLLAGHGIETWGEASRAVLAFGDNTRLELAPETAIRELKAEGGKRLFVAKGTVRAEVARQPQGEPMMFATPHGDATVLGTTLKIFVDPDPKRGTRLEVEEGKVALKNPAGKPVLVESGHFAVAATGIEPAARRLPIDEILLLPRHGRIVGQSWKKVSDDRSSTGEALELLKIPGPNPRRIEDTVVYIRTVHVMFAFEADAEKDYFVWVRGRCPTPERLRSQDELGLEVPGGLFNNADRLLVAAFGLSVAAFQGYSDREGYWWVGGNADLNPPDPRPDDVRPTTIRFSQPGRKTLRLYATEVPMRVDAIWLSATQKTRPADTEQGPGSRRK